MTKQEKELIIIAIVQMWSRVSHSDGVEKKYFFENLLNSSDAKLANLFFRFKREMKKQEIPREKTMFISSELYQKLKQILEEKKELLNKRQISNTEMDEIVLELLNLKKEEMYPEESDIEEPLFDASIIQGLDAKIQERLLAHTLYFLMLKESKNNQEQKLAIERIQRIYPHTNDLYANLSSLVVAGWDTKPIEACQQDYEKCFGYYTHQSDSNGKKSKRRIQRED